MVLNVEGAERLVLLWNGRQPNTFAGHIDTTRPLRVHAELISSSFAPEPPAPEPSVPAAAPEPSVPEPSEPEPSSAEGF